MNVQVLTIQLRRSDASLSVLVLFIAIFTFVTMAWTSAECPNCIFQGNEDCGVTGFSEIECCYACKKWDKWYVAGGDYVEYRPNVARNACVGNPNGGDGPVDISNFDKYFYASGLKECPDADDDCGTIAAVAGEPGDPVPIISNRNCKNGT